MIAVYWLLQHVSDVPAADDWLSAAERAVLAGFSGPRRIRDWRLGRWTAKRALAALDTAGTNRSNPATWACISIRATEAGVPCALVGGSEAPWVLSLSHAGECGFCAVAPRPAAIGCDVEAIGRRAEEFVIDWFTEAERAVLQSMTLADDRSRLITLVWSAKESALKALGVGLRLDPRRLQVEVSARDVRSPGSDVQGPNSGWHPLIVQTPERPLQGWWATNGGHVFTVIADPAPGVPSPCDPRP